ncbi:nucleoside hydrolase [Flavobacteriaceae bacterium 3-367]
MKHLIQTTLLCGLAVSFVLSHSVYAQTKAPIKIIFDTDFGGDADDLGALAMLNHFQNKGEIELLSIMCWNLEKYVVSAIDAVNTYYGNPDIPIGLRKGRQHITDWNHAKPIADNLPHNATFENVPEATQLYRKLLGESDDKSLVIVTVGPLLNIKNLIDSKPDAYSPLDGLALINAKVKEFVIMGGNFPKSENEWNFDGDMPGVTKYVLDHLELPITFLGAELGASLKTGEVFNALPKDSPLYLGFYHFSKYALWMKHQFKGKIYDNATFDQTAVLYAVRNGEGCYWHRVGDGFCEADATGGNTWKPRENSNHSYLVLDTPIAEMELELERFMLGDF